MYYFLEKGSKIVKLNAGIWSEYEVDDPIFVKKSAYDAYTNFSDVSRYKNGSKYSESEWLRIDYDLLISKNVKKHKFKSMPKGFAKLCTKGTKLIANEDATIFYWEIEKTNDTIFKSSQYKTLYLKESDTLEILQTKGVLAYDMFEVQCYVAKLNGVECYFPKNLMGYFDIEEHGIAKTYWRFYKDGEIVRQKKYADLNKIKSAIRVLGCMIQGKDYTGTYADGFINLDEKFKEDMTGWIAIKFDDVTGEKLEEASVDDLIKEMQKS